MDRFVTTSTPGLLILHGYGNVFERRADGRAKASWWNRARFFTRIPSVTMQVEFQKLGTGFFGGTNMSLARMTGPGPHRHPVDVRASPHRVEETTMFCTNCGAQIPETREFLRRVRRRA